MNIEDKKDIYNRVMESLSSDIKKLLEDYVLDDYSEEEFKQMSDKITLPDEVVDDIQDQIIAKKRFNDKLERLWEFMLSFDVNSIPENIRDKENKVDYDWAYRRNHRVINEDGEYEHDCLFESKFTQDYSGIERIIDIDENAKVWPASEVAAKLCSFFSINGKYSAWHSTCNNIESMFEIAGPKFNAEHEPIGMVVPLTDEMLKMQASREYINIHIVDRLCMEYGYYRVREIKCRDNKGASYVKCVYIPVRDVPVREQIVGRRIVHASPKQFYEKIKRNGIIPRNSKRTYKYLYKKAYFFLYNKKLENEKEYNKMMTGICRKSFDLGMINSTIYNIYHIKNYSEYMSDVTFYWDPVEDNCVYTRKTILPNYIKRSYWVDFDKEPVKYNELPDGVDGENKLPGDKGRD